MSRTAFTLSAFAALALAAPGVASAGGFDTPILYSARNIGMGGTGISFADDPTAIFINPAGIGHTPTLAVTIDFSPIYASIDAPPTASKDKTAPQQQASALAPAFLAGISGRVWKYLTLGIGVYPLASAGAGYDYPDTFDKSGKRRVTDETEILFIEVSPAIAFNYKDLIRIGFGYRMTIASLKRLKKSGDTPTFDMEVKGVDFSGWRVGVQSTPIPGLELGMVYRHQINPTLEDKDGGKLLLDFDRITMDLTLPSRLGVGARYDIPLGETVNYLGLALDYEYAWQSQNKTSTIKGYTDGNDKSTDFMSHFRWTDASTVRAGLELGLKRHWRVRAGYIWDQITANPQYPSAFGTPPVDTHSGTIGFGWRSGAYEANFAYALRYGNTTVTEQDIEGADTCITCSKPGDYTLMLHGIYLDFTYRML